MKIFNRFFLLSLLIITSCKTQFVATSNDKQLYKVSSNGQTDTLSEIDAYLKPFRDSLNITMNEVIGEAMGDFIKEKPSGSLGNLVVDAMLYEAQNSKFRIQNKNPQLTTDNRQLISGAITNPGGLRINQIPKGKITKGKIFELLPFENELVIVEVKGTVLRQWMELIKNNGGWPMSNIYFKNNSIFYNKIIPLDSVDAEKGTKLNIFKVKEESFNIDSTYFIATNDYVANGGDKCDFLIPCKKYPIGKTIRELVISFINITRLKYIFPNDTYFLPFPKDH